MSPAVSRSRTAGQQFGVAGFFSGGKISGMITGRLWTIAFGRRLRIMLFNKAYRNGLSKDYP